MVHAGGEGPRPGSDDGHGPGECRDAALRVFSLGRLTVARGGQALNLGGPRQRAVFALLLIARGSVVTGDRLIDSLWDGALPPGAMGTLHAYVSRLRRLFEPDRAAGARQGVIVTEGSGYALRIDENDENAEDMVDAWRFERLLNQATAATSAGEAVTALSRALGLWRGPAAFAEFADERWARPEADRLAELREVTRERLLAARLDRGETAVLVPDAEALVAELRLYESCWRRCLPTSAGSFATGLAVTTVRAHTAPGGPGCDGTATVTGTLTTNGRPGTVRYRWIRSDGTVSPVLRQFVPAGVHHTDVVLRWSFSGHGTMRAVATLDILSPGSATASTAFTYRCP